MAVPNRSGDPLDVATILAVAVAKVQLLDEALAWRRQAPRTPGLQRQIDALLGRRESIVATLDSLRRSLVDPLSPAHGLAGLPSPRPEVRTLRLDSRQAARGESQGVANRWWAAA